MRANQELSDLIEALGCGIGDRFMADDLRYEKIIIMDRCGRRRRAHRGITHDVLLSGNARAY